MFEILGSLVSRIWPVVLAGWTAVFVCLWYVAPPWEQVAQSGQFSFLPAHAPTRRAEQILHEAFPDKFAASNIVVVVYRKTAASLRDEDRAFIQRLHTHLKELAAKHDKLVIQVLSPDEPIIGPLLLSRDQQAGLIIMNLRNEFLDRRTGPLVQSVRKLVTAFAQELPTDLGIALTGSAVIGHDFDQAQNGSVRRIETWSIWVVLILLLVVFRAPLLALIPLVTLMVSVEIAVRVLTLLAAAGHINLFLELRVYTAVLLYGASVDFSMFLLSRYQEEITRSATVSQAVTAAMAGVGAAISASAATVIVGISMLTLTEFGKFQQAGIAIALGLSVMLAATLTLSPALLCLFRHVAFWPWGSERLGQPAWSMKVWNRLGEALQRRPGTIFLMSLALLLIPAVFAIRQHNHLTYSLLGELPPNTPSVVGLNKLAEHFPMGSAGPVTLILEDKHINFASDAGISAIEKFSDRLKRQRRPLELVDIRSVAYPVGISEVAGAALLKKPALPFLDELIRGRVAEYYVGAPGHVTRIELVLNSDPFTHHGIDQLGKIEETLRQELPAELAGTAKVHVLGLTASLRDLRAVAERDGPRVQILVTLSVLLVLIVMLRRVGISIYLMLTVLLGYLATIGVTFAVFWLLRGNEYSRLHFAVPTLLFTLLIAVGMDYNIFLVTRVEEEQRRHGLVEGIKIGLTRTGGIISSCGLIMAGTFASLLVGTLASAHELGFSLALGVFLDTMVIRPVLVPAYLMLIYGGRFRVLRSAMHAGTPGERVGGSH